MNSIPSISLSELANKIGAVIKSSFINDSYWVVAEISGHKFYPKDDRHYFEFIEKSDKNADPVAKLKGWSIQGQDRFRHRARTGAIHPKMQSGH